MKLFLKIFAFLSLTALAIAQPTPTFSVTANSSGTIIAPSNVKVGLTSQVNGILPIANGGTGTTAPGESAGTGIAVSGSFPNKTISNTGVTNLVAGTGVTLNTNNGSVTINATGTGGTVTSVGSTGTVQGISLTGTVTTSGSLTLGGSLSPINLGTQVTGTLNVASGGTGVTSSSGANSVVLRDSNSNASVNNLFEGFSTITASGTTVTLTVASVQNFVVNGSGGQIIKLPDATTLSNGTDFIFNNNQSSGTVTVQNNSATTVCTLQSGSYIVVTLLSNSTAAGTWDYHNVAPSNASWSTNTLNWAGSYTNGTWNGNAVGALYGGTGTTGLTGYVYGNGTSAMTASTTIPTTALSGTVTNAQLANSAITIAGTSTSLGGSISQDTITGLSTTGIVKRTGANTLAIATSGSDYSPATSTTNILYGNGSGGFSPVTVGSGLTFTAGTLASTAGGGSVTSVSVTGNSGVLAGVATATTTPAISIGLGNITPTSVNAPIGNTTPSTGAFTTLNSSGQTLLATSTGNVGIGSTSPTSKLFVNSTSTAPSPHAAMYYDNPTAFFTTGDGGQANTYARIAGGLYGGASSTNLDLLAFCNDFTYPVGFRIGAVTSGTVGGHGQSEDLVFNYLKWGSYGDTLSANEFMRYGTSPQTSGDNRTLWIESNASSTSTTSGALVVTGGVGVGGDSYFGAKLYLPSTGAAVYFTNVNAQVQDTYLGVNPQVSFRSSTSGANHGALANMYLGRKTYSSTAGTGNDETDLVGLWMRGYYNNTANPIPLYFGGTAYNSEVPYMTLGASGVLQLNTYGAGTLVTNSSGVISASSDARLKNVKHPFTTGLKAITQIHPAVYSWKSEEKEGVHTTYAGFIAQDVQKAIPEAVGQGKDGYLTLQDRAITAALVNAIKEQQKEIEDLQQQIKQLSKQP